MPDATVTVLVRITKLLEPLTPDQRRRTLLFLLDWAKEIDGDEPPSEGPRLT